MPQFESVLRRYHGWLAPGGGAVAPFVFLANRAHSLPVQLEDTRVIVVLGIRGISHHRGQKRGREDVK
jgi:hypothetical protein